MKQKKKLLKLGSLDTDYTFDNATTQSTFSRFNDDDDDDEYLACLQKGNTHTHPPTQ